MDARVDARQPETTSAGVMFTENLLSSMSTFLPSTSTVIAGSRGGRRKRVKVR